MPQNYIDRMCPEALIIEVDGFTHQREAQLHMIKNVKTS